MANKKPTQAEHHPLPNSKWFLKQGDDYAFTQILYAWHKGYHMVRGPSMDTNMHCIVIFGYTNVASCV